MSILGVRWIRIANDLLHDLAAGAWPGAVAALWLAQRRADLPVDVAPEVARSWSSIFWVMVVALAILVITGLIRTNYRANGLPPEVAQARGSTAVVKHVFFVGVFAAATAVAIVIL